MGPTSENSTTVLLVSSQTQGQPSQIPIGRLITSLGQRDDTDRMIDLGIAFESLYLGGSDSRSKIRLRFARRASQYLERTRQNEKGYLAPSRKFTLNVPMPCIQEPL